MAEMESAILLLLACVLNFGVRSTVAVHCNVSTQFRVLNCNVGPSSRLYPAVERVVPTIYLNNSKIMDITDDAFDTVTELRKLLLNDNFLVEMKPRWFRNLANLEYVDVSRNQITNYVPGTFQNVRILQRLLLPYNSLMFFDGRQDPLSKAIVDLSRNPLNEVYFDRIHSLHMNNTNATQLIITSAANIYAEYSAIETFSASEGVSDKLHLRGNNIRDLTNLTSSFSQMYYLDLSQNFIGMIPANAFQYLSGLRVLNISKIDLYQMYYGMFSSQRALEVLDLSYNYLWHLNLNKIFPARLRELYVLGNAIWKVTDSRKVLRSLEKLGIAGNELSCERLFKIYFKAMDRGVEFYTPPYMMNYSGDNIAGMPCRNVV